MSYADKTEFERERDRLIAEIAEVSRSSADRDALQPTRRVRLLTPVARLQNLAKCCSSVNQLNRNIENVIEVGKGFDSVHDLWQQFETVMTGSDPVRGEVQWCGSFRSALLIDVQPTGSASRSHSAEGAARRNRRDGHPTTGYRTRGRLATTARRINKRTVKARSLELPRLDFGVGITTLCNRLYLCINRSGLEVSMMRRA